MKVYKIDLNVANSSYKRWEDTLTQSSGAEKFVVFFGMRKSLELAKRMKKEQEKVKYEYCD